MQAGRPGCCISVPSPIRPSRACRACRVAEWIPYGAGPGRPPVGGAVKVVTTGLKEGYLRRNGVPYSGKTVLTEYIDVLEQPDGSTWLVVQTLVEDPLYHNGVLLSSTQLPQATGSQRLGPGGVLGSVIAGSRAPQPRASTDRRMHRYSGRSTFGIRRDAMRHAMRPLECSARLGPRD